MKVIYLLIFLYIGPYCIGQIDGVSLIGASSLPLNLQYDDQVLNDFVVNRNFGFQLNVPFKIQKLPEWYYEFNYGVDSYSFNLPPNGILRAFSITYFGASIGYEYKWKVANEFDFMRVSGGISFLHFQGARSKIGVSGSSNNISTSAALGNRFPLVFSPFIKLDYNWQVKSLKSYRLGIYAATSFQNILIGDFSIIGDQGSFSGSIHKKHEYFGIHFGFNISSNRRKKVEERMSKGLLKDPKPIDNTISKLTYGVNFGTGSKIFIRNPNVFAAEQPEQVNLNFTYGFDISRSIPFFDRHHAFLALSYNANDSELRALYRNPTTNELFTIDTKLSIIHLVSAGLGYHFLKNKSNKDNFIQISPQVNLNVNLIQDESIEILNPENSRALWVLSTQNEGRVFFSSKLSINHLRKMNDNRYLRLGVSVERGRDLLVGKLVDNNERISEFYQNNFAIRFHVGILLKSEQSKI